MDNLNSNLKRLIRKLTTSTIHIIIGPRGSGKTLLMSGGVARQLILCLWANHCLPVPRPLRVWSKHQVEFMYRASDDGATWPGAEKPVRMKNELLNIYKLYTFDDEMRYGFVNIDELDMEADRQDWQNGGQKLLMAILRQIRKRHLSLAASIQSLTWLNPRFLFQVDLITSCRDSSFTPWGKENGLEPGEVIFLTSTDRSGRETGYTVEENSAAYEATLYGKPLFPIYETDQEFNPFEHMERLTIKKRHVVLDPHVLKESDHTQTDKAILEKVLTEHVEAGDYRAKVKVFIDNCKAQGLVMSRRDAIDYVGEAFNAGNYEVSGYPYLSLENVQGLKLSENRLPMRIPEGGRGRIKGK